MRSTVFLSIMLLLLSFEAKAQFPVLVKDLAAGTNSSDPDNFAVVDNKLLFAANSYSGGGINRELFVSDGTSAGTHILVDIISGPLSSSPQKMIAYNNKVYFIITDSTSGNIVYRPWVSDGTVSGTYPVFPLAVTPAGYTMDFNNLDSPENIFVEFNGEVYFRARKDNLVNDFAVFKTDGSFAGATIVAELQNVTSIPNLIKGPVVFRDSLYFSGTSNGSVTENLYRSAGTLSSLALFKADVVFNTEMGHAVYNHLLFFCGSNSQGNGPELWLTDGSASGTYELANIRPDAGIGSSPGSFTVIDGKVYFIANSSGTGVELFYIDSTQASFFPVQVSVISFLPFSYQDNYLFAFNNELFFTGHDFLNGRELWSTDGTTAGTGIVVDLNPGSGDADPSCFEIYCGDLYFSAYNPTTQVLNALYKSDGTSTGTVLVPGLLNNPSGGSQVGDKAILNDKLYFGGLYDYPAGNELHSYDAGCVTTNAEIPESYFSLFPNPATSGFYLQADNAEPYTIEIFDVSGRIISPEFAPGNSTSYIDVSNWIGGCYVVKTRMGSSVSFKKLVVSGIMEY